MHSGMLSRSPIYIFRTRARYSLVTNFLSFPSNFPECLFSPCSGTLRSPERKIQLSRRDGSRIRQGWILSAIAAAIYVPFFRWAFLVFPVPAVRPYLLYGERWCTKTPRRYKNSSMLAMKEGVCCVRESEREGRRAKASESKCNHVFNLFLETAWGRSGFRKTRARHRSASSSMAQRLRHGLPQKKTRTHVLFGGC